MHGDAVLWGPSEHLLADVVDRLALANWQRSGGKSRRPKRIQRPSDKRPKQQRLANSEVYERLLEQRRRRRR